MKEEYQKEKFERYIILKDKVFFAGFNEGEESRFGQPMSYPVFISEFNACIAFWEERDISPFRFSYVINLEYRHRIIRPMPFAESEEPVACNCGDESRDV